MDVRFVTQDEGAICNNFHNRIYGGNRTLSQWRWEFVSIWQLGTKLPFVIAEDEGQIISTDAFIPIRMIDSEGVFWTVKSEETLIDPAYRGQKLLERMNKLLFEYLRENKIHCIWGFTTATKVYQRLGFAVPGSTSQIFFPFTGRSAAAIFEQRIKTEERRLTDRLKTLGLCIAGTAASLLVSAQFALKANKNRLIVPNLRITVLETPPIDAGLVCEQFIRNWGGTTIYRDASYLAWRMYDNPYVKSVVQGAYYQDQLVGWIAYCLGDDQMGYIVDIMVAPEASSPDINREIITQLLKVVVKDLKARGALGIRGWHVNNHPFDKMVADTARRIGFFCIKRGLPMVLHIEASSARKGRLETFDNWYVTRINTEGVSG